MVTHSRENVFSSLDMTEPSKLRRRMAVFWLRKRTSLALASGNPKCKWQNGDKLVNHWAHILAIYVYPVLWHQINFLYTLFLHCSVWNHLTKTRSLRHSPPPGSAQANSAAKSRCSRARRRWCHCSRRRNTRPRPALTGSGLLGKQWCELACYDQIWFISISKVLREL